jgi:hypothetical protein
MLSRQACASDCDEHSVGPRTGSPADFRQVVSLSSLPAMTTDKASDMPKPSLTAKQFISGFVPMFSMGGRSAIAICDSHGYATAAAPVSEWIPRVIVRIHKPRQAARRLHHQRPEGAQEARGSRAHRYFGSVARNCVKLSGLCDVPAEFRLTTMETSVPEREVRDSRRITKCSICL